MAWFDCYCGVSVRIQQSLAHACQEQGGEQKKMVLRATDVQPGYDREGHPLFFLTMMVATLTGVV